MAEFLFKNTWALLLPAALSFLCGWYKAQRQKRKEKWLKTTGVIKDRYDGVYCERGAQIIIYQYLITYGFSLDGKEYEGRGYCDPNDYSDSEADRMEKITGQFALGAPIDVYYDPRNPDDYALFVAKTGEGMTWHLAGVIIVLFYLAITFL